MRPSKELIERLGKDVYLLVVSVGGHTKTASAYVGNAFWIGCSKDVAIPERLQQLLRQEPSPEVRNHWLGPIEVDLDAPLEPGSTIRLAIESPDRTPVAGINGAEFTIRKADPGNWPQFEEWRISPPIESPPLAWAEVLEAEPDPQIVVDQGLCTRIVETGLPWRVRDRKTGLQK